MKTKVVLRYDGRNHWDYMVYNYSVNRNEWIPVQYFKHNQRKKAIEYAKDIAKIPIGHTETDIWVSE